MSGLILFNVYFQIVYAGSFLTEFEGMIIPAVALLILIFSFTIGFVSQLSTTLLIIVLPIFNGIYGTNSLGTAICIQLLFVILFSGQGIYYSIDNYLINQRGLLSSIVRKLYSTIGVPDSQQLKFIYVCGFISYALISFGALSYHLQDRYWLSGDTVGMLLTGSFTSSYYDFFRELFTLYPGVFDIFSKVAAIAQSIFQFFMIPLLCFHRGKLFVFWWGLIFFFSSLFLLELSSLPYFEIFLWITIFTRPQKTKRIQIFFDENCRLCSKTTNILGTLNFNNSIEFTPMGQMSPNVESLMDPEKLKVLQGGLYNGKIYYGYDLYLLIAKNNPLYFVFIPVFLIGKWTKLGYIIYSTIANRRYRFMGTCSVDRVLEPSAKKTIIYNGFMMVSIKYFYSFCWIMFFLFQFPYISDIKNNLVSKIYFKGDYISALVEKILHHSGFDMPIVFNEHDLLLNETWFVLYRINDSVKEILPIINESGGRMQYFFRPDLLLLKNHGSDLLYFGTTLQYRRGIIDSDIADFHAVDGYGTLLIKKIIEIDRNKMEYTRSKYYFEVRNDSSMRGYSKKTISPNRFQYKVLLRDTISISAK